MRDYTASVTEEQRDFMSSLMQGHSQAHETYSNTLREWYNKGQRVFRHYQKFGGLDIINDLEFEDDVHREGFMMGWNSDQWAVSNGKPLSVLGGERFVNVESLAGGLSEEITDESE